jgi:hypothetical protein
MLDSIAGLQYVSRPCNVLTDNNATKWDLSQNWRPYRGADGVKIDEKSLLLMRKRLKRTAIRYLAHRSLVGRAWIPRAVEISEIIGVMARQYSAANTRDGPVIIERSEEIDEPPLVGG